MLELGELSQFRGFVDSFYALVVAVEGDRSDPQIELPGRRSGSRRRGNRQSGVLTSEPFLEFLLPGTSASVRIYNTTIPECSLASYEMAMDRPPSRPMHPTSSNPGTVPSSPLVRSPSHAPTPEVVETKTAIRGRHDRSGRKMVNQYVVMEQIGKGMHGTVRKGIDVRTSEFVVSIRVLLLHKFLPSLHELGD